MIQVSKQEFELDLENTKRELDAYRQLANGHSILADLPENAGPSAATHNFKASAYRDSQIQCGEFLAKLEAYGKEHFPSPPTPEAQP